MAGSTIEDVKQDYSVMNGLFGINPDALAFQRQQQNQANDQAQAERIATMTPQQQATTQQLAGAAGLGRAIGPAVQGMFGMHAPVDPQMAFATKMRGIMNDLRNEGYDLSDPVKTQAEAGKRLIAAGFDQQGNMALENARRMGMERDQRGAEINLKNAEAVKAGAEAQKAQQIRDPIVVMAQNGHLDPQSFAARQDAIANGTDPQEANKLLRPMNPDTWEQVKVNGHVIMVNKKDNSVRVDLGEDNGVLNNQNNNKTRLAIQGVGADGTPNGNIEAAAQAVASGQIPALTGRALTTPRGMAIMQRVMEIKPDFWAGQFPTSQAAEKAFTSGPLGSQARSLNAVDQHVDVLLDAAAELKNSGSNTLSNYLQNKIGQFEGNPKVSGYEGVKTLVAAELAKAIMANGSNPTALADRQEMQKEISAALKPEQLQEVVTRWRQLITGQLNALEQQYRAGKGDQNADFKGHILGWKPDTQHVGETYNPNGNVPSNAGPDVQSLLTAGRAAKTKGTDEYTSWWRGLSDEERKAINTHLGR